MASTKYDLQIRATLDTTQVKQQLNQLRSQMTQLKTNAMGPARTQTAAASAGTPNIASALRSLQSSIDRLNQNISRLASGGVTPGISRNGANSPYLPGRMGKDGNGYSKTDVKKTINYWNRKMDEAQAAGDAARISRIKRSLDRAMARRNIDSPSKASTNITDGWFSGDKYGSKANRRIMRGLAGQYLLGGITDALGQDTVYGKITGAAQQGLMVPAMTTAMFPKMGGGALGILGVGSAIASGIVALSESLLAGAQKISAASDKAAETLAGGKKAIAGHVEQANEMKWRDRFQFATDEQQRKELADIRTRKDWAQNKYYSLTDNAGNSMNEAARNYLRELNNLPEAKTGIVQSWITGADNGRTESMVALEQKYGDAVVAYAKKIEAAKQELDKLTQKESFLSKAVEGRAQSEEASQKAIDAAGDYEQKMQQFGVDRILQKAIKREDLNALIQNRERIIGERQQNRDAMKEIDAAGGLKKWTTGTASLTKTLQMTQDPAMRDILSNLISEREKKASEYQRQGDKAMNATTQIDSLSELIRKIRTDRKISDTQQTIDDLQTRLGDLKSPNMENVNSLAQYGFGISQKDDDIRWKSQVDYQKEQVTLQREIRDNTRKLKDLETSQYQ